MNLQEAVEKMINEGGIGVASHYDYEDIKKDKKTVEKPRS